MKKYFSYVSLIIFITFILSCHKKNDGDGGEQYWTSLSLGGSHTCGITNHGQIQCFGGNYAGQLGIGQTAYISTPKPQKVLNLESIQKLYDNSNEGVCALDSQGGVFCWGRNDFGQLGFGHRNTVYRATLMNQGISARYVFFGPFGGYLIDLSGVPYRFGDFQDVVARPTQDNALPKNIKQIHQFSGQICYLEENNKVACREKSIFDAEIEFERLSGRGLNVCALTKDKKLWCGRFSDPGRFGDPSHQPEKQATIFSNNAITDFCVSHAHICAIDMNGAVYCAGDNKDGQLGTGDTKSSASPRQASIVKEHASAVFCNAGRTCVLTATNKAFCFGADHLQSMGQTKASGIYINGIELPQPDR